MDRSFAALRLYARDHNLRLTEVARAVAGRELSAERLLDHARRRAAQRARPSEP